MKLIGALLFVVLAAQCLLSNAFDEEDLPNYPDAEDNQLMDCVRSSMNEASANNPGSEGFFENAINTIESLIAQRRICYNMTISDPPRPWEEKAKELCIASVRARLLFEMNNLRTTMAESGIENATEIISETRVLFDICMNRE